MGSILKELPELISNNVITPQTAKDIERYYAIKKQPEGSTTLLTVFGGLGAILVGLGIILIFAHNWDTFPKGIKTMLALLPLFTFQGLTAYTIARNKSHLWKDASGTLLFFSVGGAMALVAQIYNIPGDLSGFLFMWVLLCAPLMYFLRSNTLALLHIVFSTYYAVEAGYFNPERPWGYLLFVAALLPFYINKIKHEPESNTVSIFSWLLPLSLIITMGSFLDGVGEFGFLIYMTLLCLLYNIGRLPYFTERKLRRNGYLCLGITGMAVVLLITSFRDVWKGLQGDKLALVYFITLWGMLFAGAVYLMVNKKQKLFKDGFQAVTIIFPLIYLMGMFNGAIAAIACNLLVLAMGILCIKEGIDKLDFKVLNFGLVVISALIICRFFDTEISFAVRGLLFVAVGVGFFLANYLLIRKKRNSPINTLHHEN